ncbi:MAG: DUF3822 family protein [Chitinophagales bacterium]|jgi:hypothetical protein|nr:DUF3822 family protein [Chitinophagales bacterium]
MHLHPHCFSFALIDNDLNKIVEFDAKVLNQPLNKFLVADSISMWLQEHQQVLSLPFKNSKVAIFSPEFTILPDKTDKPKEVFNLLGYSQNEHITYLKNKLDDNFYVYYSLPDKLINFIENNLINVEFYCSDFGLLKFYNSKLSFKNYIAANLYGEELTICYKKNSQNFYYNKFPVKSKDDLLYYLRLAYEHLELNLNEFPTYLYGFVEEKSPMYSTTYGYIRNFEIDRTLKNTLPFSFSIEGIPLHYYINLMGLAL